MRLQGLRSVLLKELNDIEYSLKFIYINCTLNTLERAAKAAAATAATAAAAAAAQLLPV